MPRMGLMIAGSSPARLPRASKVNWVCLAALGVLAVPLIFSLVPDQPPSTPLPPESEFEVEFRDPVGLALTRHPRHCTVPIRSVPDQTDRQTDRQTSTPQASPSITSGSGLGSHEKGCTRMPTTQRNAKQRNATQRNATQRNVPHRTVPSCRTSRTSVSSVLVLVLQACNRLSSPRAHYLDPQPEPEPYGLGLRHWAETPVTLSSWPAKQ
ncbi:hypothetical protein B0T24DRAFT_150709 [Lasiosphaeria ovina]|uniref:Uncharacterized protein n=1 Tax=Lasiosphaeria ovina TaxID=92902 RepID=A0AAE0KMB2_9PEZI|nr:hypothetical protein B0T24DRAFT_150709 [Lasiosphaeria ovina]